jgi:hypothetical protein
MRRKMKDKDACCSERKNLMSSKRRKSAKPKSRWHYSKAMLQSVWEAFRSLRAKAN